MSIDVDTPLGELCDDSLEYVQVIIVGNLSPNQLRRRYLHIHISYEFNYFALKIFKQPSDKIE
jgi:hypothetical protein